MRSATPLPRQAFPVCQRWNYLNHAGVNALPTPVAEAMAGWAEQATLDGSLAGDPDAEMDELRAGGARLMGVQPDEVALVKNTTEGLAFVAGGLEWTPGDRVVVPDREFPSNFYPWTALMDRGVIVDTVPSQGDGEVLTADAMAQVIKAGPPPKVVSLSWVQYARGWRSDLAAVASIVHDAGSLLCVDVIQGLGLLPADLASWGVDFASADAHKWLLGPPGIGFLYVRQGLIDLLRPLEPGWASVLHREEYDNLDLVWDPSARRFEGGTANLPGIAGLGAAVELLSKVGIETIWRHVDDLCVRMVEALTESGAEVLTDRRDGGSSGIVTFRLPGHDGAQTVERLKERGIVTAARGGGVRASPHGYTTVEEIDQLAHEVGSLLSAGPAAGSL